MRSVKVSPSGNALLLTLLLILPGCAETTGSSESLSPSIPQANRDALRFCDGAKPFYWDETDTDDTITQAKAHNAVGIKFCKWN